MTYLLSIPVMIIAAALQASLLPLASIFGGAPDLVFLLALAWALNSPLEEGIAWAFAGGIVKDMLSAAPIGTSVVGAVLVIFGVQLVRQQLYTVGVLSLTWIALLGSLAQQATILLIVAAVGFRPASPAISLFDWTIHQVTAVILPTLVYNLVLIFPVYGFVRSLQKRLERRKVSFN